MRVSNGQLLGVDLSSLVRRHNDIATQLVNG